MSTIKTAEDTYRGYLDYWEIVDNHVFGTISKNDGPYPDGVFIRTGEVIKIDEVALKLYTITGIYDLSTNKV